ncbi:hypothetical protein JC777_14805 [Bacillus cytotoxicus]|nr:MULTISPECIES: hypothetical protein [Bacillus cereus group]QTR81836.1 hypothetical protein JC777_14805 [Bacillus cytotoxicus]QTR85573.1 hypothetical protein JC774_13310 [Bacillus cytotoxicus]HDR4573101.1 hypothetical protein [Bacillus cytotoxicus]HDR4589135.1 hypothetical protein [Bacillus cytotoxicus]
MKLVNRKKTSFRLRLGNLQHFSDPNPGDPQDPPTPKHTDEDVQRMIDEALAKAKAEADEKAEKERQKAEQERLKEKEDYKKLYENLQQQLAQQKAKALDAKKEAILASANYAPEQIVLVKDLLKGETDEELQQSLESVKSVVLPLGSGADPSPGNSKRDNPEPKDLADVGRELYARLKANGKL